MKILFLAGKIPVPPRDGGSLATYHLLKGLYDEGAELSFFALNTRKHFADIKQVKALFPRMRLLDFEADLSIKPLAALLNLFSHKSYNIERFNIPRVRQALTKLLQEEQFDLLHIDSLFMVPYLPLLRKYSRAKVVLRAHNVEFQIWERMAAQASPGLKKKYLSLLASRLKRFELEHLNSYDHLLAISDTDAESFRQLGASVPMSVHPSGFDFDTVSAYAELQAQADFFYIGSMDWQPNEEAVRWLLAQVWPGFSQAQPQVMFHLAGRHMPADLQESKQANCRVHGEVENAYAFMASHHFMLVPLFSGSGIRIKIIEAMAMGKTIIASRLAASGIHAVEGKEILLADTAEEFLQAMNFCIQEPEKALEIGRQAARFAKAHFDNRILAKSLLSLYRSLV